MKTRGWSKAVIIRYALLQLPGLLLLILLLLLVRRYFDFSAWYTGLVIGAWVLKDVILFPFVWRAYDWGMDKKKHPMVGLEGYVTHRIDPEGYVRVRGELWRAETKNGEPMIDKGASVRVSEIRGLTLIVTSKLKGISIK